MEQLRDWGWFAVLVLMVAAIVFVASRPSEAEHHHCMVTATDKSICGR